MTFNLRYMSKDFETMKAGNLAIWPWLICQYNKNTLVDLHKSFFGFSNSKYEWWDYGQTNRPLLKRMQVNKLPNARNQ